MVGSRILWVKSSIFVLVLGAQFLAGLAFADKLLEKKKHSQLTLVHKKVDDKKSMDKAGCSDHQLQIKPLAGLVINNEAPWKLIVNSRQSKDKTTIKAESMQKTDVSFTLPSDKKFDYRLAAYVCTEDKKTCYREVFQGSYACPNKK